MSQIHTNFKTFSSFIFTLPIFFLLFGCGGGGGSDSNQETNVAPVITTTISTTPIIPVPTSGDYSPDATKLTSVAGASKELFVDPNFTFSNYKIVIFDIDVTDANNKPMNNLMLSISVIDNGIVEFDDPRLQEKSFLAKAKTNNNGQIYFSLELPIRVSNILLELNAVGLENNVIFSLDDRGTVTHHFHQQL